MKSSPESQQPIQYFRVKIGHHSVVVAGASAQDAIEQARRQLCDDMPRLWDVIRSLDDDRFDVAPAA